MWKKEPPGVALVEVRVLSGVRGSWSVKSVVMEVSGELKI
jgi:hypothetical protein